MEEPALLVAAAVLMALAATGTVAVWTIRLIWRRLVQIELTDLRLRAGAARPRPSAAWLSAQAGRRRLRLAVCAAERTVTEADRAHLPLGELPMLCRDLRRVQRDLDRRLMLAAAHGHRADRATAQQVAAVCGNAERVRLLAARALDEAAEPAIRRLAATVETEATALEAGRASWRRQVDSSFR